MSWYFPPALTVTDVDELIARLHAAFEREDLHYGHGTDNAWDEAVNLVLDSLHLGDDKKTLRVTVSDPDEKRILDRMRRRIDDRIPVPYLTGQCHFGGLTLAIEPGVIIPRSPIGELIANDCAPWIVSPVNRVLDLCCGSGCLGIAAAVQFPEAEVVCVDLDDQALNLARKNIVNLGLQSRVSVVKSDLFQALDKQKFELILCNPPYVNTIDMNTMPREFQHEPQLALAGGNDGLDFVRRIVKQIAVWLQPAGILILEMGNSAAAWDLAVSVTWPELESGGEGVLVLEARRLNSHTGSHDR